ncbi:TPA: TatD family hydrolase [archaeon]|uniref:TatD family hydrolase n=1 Tax=Candidatus Naiadarchaeum limnaeum TaxID=2756139 RepID=A0A832V1B4_9ARCH|nr:TatD family hydrolase [Candidatus Naiadarchaeales archaeon SRR2090153.bin1042]HIK00266.1 TatD family hydrolase [Candidatus Naiadarchaeum limnaeum]
MELIDCHSHINLEDFDSDRAEVLRSAEKSGITAILDSGGTYSECEKVLQLAEKFKILKPSLGWHPANINLEEAKRTTDFIRTAASENKIYAIGEIGLDYWIVKEETQRETQKEIFKIYIDLAKELNLPIVTHSRSAGKYVIEILEQEKAEKVCMHAFDGKFGSAKKGIELGYCFSIPPSIVRSEQKQKLVKNLPLENLLLESDAPVLGPNPKERNVPSNIKVAVQKIAEIKKVDISEAIKTTTRNAKKLFALE